MCGRLVRSAAANAIADELCHCACRKSRTQRRRHPPWPHCASLRTCVRDLSAISCQRKHQRSRRNTRGHRDVSLSSAAPLLPLVDLRGS